MTAQTATSMTASYVTVCYCSFYRVVAVPEFYVGSHSRVVHIDIRRNSMRCKPDATLSHITVHSTRQHITRTRGRGPGAGVGSSLATCKKLASKQ